MTTLPLKLARHIEAPRPQSLTNAQAPEEGNPSFFQEDHIPTRVREDPGPYYD
jgi:hypothetical protein